MPKRTICVIYAHPAPHRSRANRLLAETARSIEGVSVLDLYQTYPDYFIDVAAEQARAAAADVLVFLHPIQWYSMPALLKEWVDAVLLPGWAYGVGGDALRGKGFLLAVTTGSPAAAYQEGGAHGHAFDAFLPPYTQTALLCGMDWLAPHVLHGAHLVDDAALQAHADSLRARLEGYASGALPLQPHLQG